MNLSEIERTLDKSKVDALLGSDDPKAAIVLEAGSMPPYRREHAALVALYALTDARVSSRKYDGE